MSHLYFTLCWFNHRGLRVLVLNRHPESPIPITFSTHTSEDQPESQPLTFFLTTFLLPIPIPDFNPDGSGGNHGAQIKHLKKKVRPVINHHKAWFRAARENSSQSSKGAPSVQTYTYWDGLDTDLEASLNEAIDYTLVQEEGKTDSKVKEPKTSSKTDELHLSGDTLVAEDKGSAEKGGSTKGTNLQQSTIKPDESTVKPDESTVKPDEGTDKKDESIDKQVEGTAENKDQVSRESATPTTSTPTPMVFGDDETIAQVLVTMSQNKAYINKISVNIEALPKDRSKLLKAKGYDLKKKDKI
ncbi:hypothetical protein Tco_1524570 [Tanacetum coccineum]